MCMFEGEREHRDVPSVDGRQRQMCIMNSCYTLLRPDGKTMFYLHSIGMLPNYQDKGYGSKLLSFIKEYSKEIGCSEMFLITDKGNPRACHVYEKLGGKNDYKDEIVYVYDYEKGDK
ncbi:GNAT family N-acetyltransferase [Enterococcus faecium]|uniref:GNAT family N-acetyltransferase n=1 Tax=Enterococcus faecium TaxID=1352 RepID=UPI00211D2E80|nr:GNAT family N-acetyltransferase [Enterococcus faecium]